MAALGCLGRQLGQLERGSARAAATRKVALERVFEDIHYTAGTESQTLDLRLPSCGRAPFPVIVYVHGGGYVSGDKKTSITHLSAWADRYGYAVASVDYRLLSEARFPAQVHDVKAAIRWLRGNAVAYDLDPRRFAIWGVSAGGHLAALVGTTGDSRVFYGNALGDRRDSSRVEAVIDWYGPVDWSAIDRYVELRQMGGGRPQMLDTLADQLAANPRLERQADPASEADSSDPPFLIEHGDRDTVVPLSQSARLASDLAAKMGTAKVKFVVIPGAGHSESELATPANMERIFEWLDAVLHHSP